ncbi:hypothetical protein CKK33_06745 [Mucilaginibacter sp. MD40]|uniref:gliding motility-associated C-terminal domain-containing protein n=1 Tax=Mucilaginibacter sp. MD40 TaxID=2029590 RepID=UPI000BACB4FA|nr:gliding motility-associated C-terminal domain-containing protein [Mucilaginibacter sp. MD40]PAW93209.1 hypothetical protein CKK33_06745 [Mucilaginibacter sp. MD40]
MQFKLRLLVFLVVAFSYKAYAQVCTGSLGDPVFIFDFGSGNNPKFPTTDYKYVTAVCPQDGEYGIAKSVTGCYGNTWNSILKDHTGNDGYMMVVNADNIANKEFFSKATTADGTNVGVLCENTTYEFSAYILNVVRPDLIDYIKPKITFVITTLAGDIIKQSPPTEIPETSDPAGWQKYGVFFTTPVGVNAVIVKMINNAPGGKGNDFVMDDIAFRPCIPDVVQINFSTDASGAPKNQCADVDGSYTIKAVPPAGYDFVWQQNINGAGWVDINESTPTLTRKFPAGSAVGVYQYRLGVAKAGNLSTQNCRVYSNAVTININAVPSPAALQPQTVCQGDVITLSASGGTTYEWTGPNLPPTTQNPLVIPNTDMANAGLYHVKVISAAGCSTTLPVTVIINARPVVTASAAVSEVCKGRSTQLTATSATAISYKWVPAAGLSDPDIANPVATPLINTHYTVTVTNAQGCTGNAGVDIVVKPLPEAGAGSNKVIFEGQSVRLNGAAGGSVGNYSWSPASSLDDPYSLTPLASPTDDVTYTLTVNSANNCDLATSQVFVRVYKKIVVPNSFSPNNDGINDLWNIEALITYPESELSVYDRNGQRIFFSRGYGKPWDGRRNGADLPAGTYYYVIDLKNGTSQLKGWVLIVR